jgi:hypothetical protein
MNMSTNLQELQCTMNASMTRSDGLKNDYIEIIY